MECSESSWRLLATHTIRLFPLHFSSRASPCAIRFHFHSNTGWNVPSQAEDCWLPTPFASFPFTSLPVRHRVPSDSVSTLQCKCRYCSFYNTLLAVKCYSSLVASGFSRNEFNSCVLLNFCSCFELDSFHPAVHIWQITLN